MSNNIVQDIWDYKAFKNSTKIPEEELTLEQIRDSVGIERDYNIGVTFYFIPVIEKLAAF